MDEEEILDMSVRHARLYVASVYDVMVEMAHRRPRLPNWGAA